MAIKKLIEIDSKKLEGLKGHSFDIYEKLDMVYFKLDINQAGIIPLKVPFFKSVSEIDILSNSIYKDIAAFSERLAAEIGVALYSKYGNIRVGFFYLPATKSKVIDYTTMEPGTFICSDAQSVSGQSVDDSVFKILQLYALPRPIIAEHCMVDDEFIASVASGESDVIGKYIESTYTKLPVESIEGVIFRLDNGDQYQIVINNAEKEVDKFSTKIYRDAILVDFANTTLADESVISGINTKTSYVQKICYLFADYMNRTDIFNRKQINAEDLLPPHNGYLGDLTVDMIPSDTAKLICRYDERARNVFRIFLYTFRKEMTDDKLQDFSKEPGARLKKLSKVLQSFNN